jgi:hypothetical protein
MKPDRSILEASFRYVPSVSTSVADTWRRFGWRPATEADLKPRERPETSAPTLGFAGTRLRHRSA